MPCFAVESLNNGLGNLFIPISFTVFGGNRKGSQSVFFFIGFLCSLFEVSFIGGSIV